MSLFFKTIGESAVSFLSMLNCGLVTLAWHLSRPPSRRAEGEAEGAEEAAAQPPMPRARWEAIAGLAAALIR